MIHTHYDDVIMTMLASQITSLAVVYSIVYSGVNQRKHQSSASLAFVREIHRGPVNFPHKWPVTRKMFPFDDVIMKRVYVPQEEWSNFTDIAYVFTTGIHPFLHLKHHRFIGILLEWISEEFSCLLTTITYLRKKYNNFFFVRPFQNFV